VLEGEVRVGLTEEELGQFGPFARKVGPRDLAPTAVQGAIGATTVGGTLAVARALGVRVLATGGIGGVHRGAFGAAASLDVSSDLEELARTAMAVVCGGPKAILDVPATLEYLETRGVPVVAVGQADIPGFYATSLGVRAPSSVADTDAAARLAAEHLALGLGSALLVCVPVPADSALPVDVAVGAIEQAIGEADQVGVGGPELTPWLLARVAAITSGASVRANTALIVNNARVAGSIAGLIATR
jgi:pseudouridine-5'-phosphate glycosidase